MTLSVVGTNDVHGALEQLPLLAGYVNNLRARRAEDGAVLLLDAGDMLQGTLASNAAEGAPVIRAYNVMGYQAAAIGNHEFDFGPVGPAATPGGGADDPLGALKARARQADFPLLTTNILERRSGRVLSYPGMAKSIVLERRGVLVGIIGGTAMDTLLTTHRSNVEHLEMASLRKRVAAGAHALRTRGADVVIALVHSGGDCASFGAPHVLSSCDQDAEVFALARSLAQEAAVDAIVGGHTHAGVAHVVEGIPIIESFSKASAFGRLDFVFDRRRRELVDVVIHAPHPLCEESLAADACTREVYEGRAVRRDPRVVHAVQPALERARQKRERPLGVSVNRPIERDDREQSALGNLFVDLMLATHPEADAALNNAGGLRADIEAGPLTYGDFYEVFPFDNRLATIRMRTRTLASIIAANLQSRGGALALAGLEAHARCQSGRLLIRLLNNGTELAPDAVLTVVTNDFLALGGDGVLKGLSLAPDAVDIEDVVMRDAIVTQLVQRQAPLDGQHPSLTRRRIHYPGTRPVHCD